MSLILRSTIFTIVCIAFVGACASQPTGLGVETGLPGNSIAAISQIIYNDAFSGTKKYLNDRYQCDDFSVVDTKIVEPKESVFMNGRGQLMHGTSVEEWTLTQCGETKTHILKIAPDGKGGNYMAFAEKQNGF